MHRCTHNPIADEDSSLIYNDLVFVMLLCLTSPQDLNPDLSGTMHVYCCFFLLLSCYALDMFQYALL